MTKKQINLLTYRLITQPQEYKGIEPISIKEKRDKKFCNDFFMKAEVDYDIVESLLKDAIISKNEFELDLIMMLLTHFFITNKYSVILAPLLVQPWHHFHDRIACILEFDKNEDVIEFLYLGSIYRCDNLEYESDYCEFNRKCLYALAKIGTPNAISYIRKASTCPNPIISKHALNILQEFCYTDS